jgi:AraC family transcriptional regulator
MVLPMINAEEFRVQETHGILWRPENRIHATSEGLGWASVYASVQDEQPYVEDFRAVDDHLIIFHLNGPVAVTRKLGRTETRRVIAPGGLFLMPGGLDFRVQLEAELSTLHLYLRRTLLEEVAAQSGCSSVELLPRLGEQDPLLERLAFGMRDALDDGVGDDASSIYVEHLSYAMAAHLLRKHSGAGRSPPDSGAGVLSKARLAQVVDYIETNLEDPLTLSELAAVCNLSPSHFARRFKATTGLPPHQYLIAVRVNRAKRLLATQGQAIVDIAYACGFTHQEHMTRIFRRQTGMTPASYRRAAML